MKTLPDYSPLSAVLTATITVENKERQIELVTCNRCGCVLLCEIGETFVSKRLHERYHEMLDKLK